MLPTFKFEMAPLDSFVVTERKPKQKEKILLTVWSIRNNITYKLDRANMTVNVQSKEPTDVEPHLSEHDVGRGWQIVWLK